MNREQAMLYVLKGLWEHREINDAVYFECLKSIPPEINKKQIALEVAVSYCKDTDCGEDDMLEVATKIYNWLIKE